MIRTALRPAWLLLLGVLVAVVVSFYQLGMWQLGVSSNQASREMAERQAARPTAELGQVTAPHQTFPDDGAGRSVAADGSYRAELQFLVPGRLLEGEPGYWVVTPLRTEASGEPALLPVLRGFVSDPAQATPPPSGEVSVLGTLAPGESPGPVDLPEGQRGAIDTADLANDWDEPIYNAFLFLVEQDPPPATQELTLVPPPVFGESGIVWRNVGYAMQWFVFALFAVYMYVRFLRDASRDPSEPTDPGRPGDRAEGHGPGPTGATHTVTPTSTTPVKEPTS